MRYTPLAFVAALVSLSACDTGSQPARNAIQAPNPAAEFCQHEGGRYRLEDGQCLMPDGKSVDAWALFRQAHEPSTKTQTPNPAAIYCQEHGEYDLETGQCTLSDGEVVDAWQWFRQQHRP